MSKLTRKSNSRNTAGKSAATKTTAPEVAALAALNAPVTKSEIIATLEHDCAETIAGNTVAGDISTLDVGDLRSVMVLRAAIELVKAAA